MDSGQLVTLIGASIGTGGLGAVLAYLVVRRRTSGQVATTDADRLWAQNDKLIETLRNDNGDLRARVTLAESRTFVVEQDNRECIKRADVFEARMLAAEALLKAFRETATAKVERAEAKVEVAEGKQQIAELKKANGGAL